MTQVVSHVNYLGVQRFWKNYERAFVTLTDNSGAVVTGLTIGDTAMTLVLPDGTSVDYKTGAPLSTFNEISTGLYEIRLWGSGTGSVQQAALEQVGNHALQIRPAASLFEELHLAYQVRAGYDIRFASTYVPGSAGSDKIRGMISVMKWYDKQVLDLSLTELTTLTLTIRDRADATFLNISETDFDKVRQYAFFDENITGLSGGDVLNAQVTLTYNGYTCVRDFPLVSRFGA